MTKKLTIICNRPFILLAVLFIIILIPDLAFGDTNFNPTPWLSNIWFAEAISFILVGLILFIRPREFISRSLPWVLAALGAFGICLYVYLANPGFRHNPPDQYNNVLGAAYYTVHNTLPYTSPFHNVDTDYLLTSDAPDFLAMQLFVLIPWLAGYVLIRQKTLRKQN